MSAGWLIRGTIILATLCWAGAETVRLRYPARDTLARVLWTAGAGLAVAHAAAALHFVHAWSHTAALDATARQTAALFGLDWSGGLYVNYAFLALWTTDTAWWWINPASYRARSPRVRGTLLAVFVFMFINGAVIFARGPARLIGIAAIGTVLWARYRARVRARSSTIVGAK